MSQQLFRDEAIEHQRTRWLGGISFARPLRSWVWVSAAVCTALAVMLYLCLGTYTRRVTVKGQLVPVNGMAIIAAPVAGVVNRIEVQEGDAVHAGQRLSTIVVPRVVPDGGDTSMALGRYLAQREHGLEDARQAQHDQLAAQTAGLRLQIRKAKDELGQIGDEIRNRQQQVTIAQETFNRLRELEDRQYVSALQVKQQQSTVLEYTSQVLSLRRQAQDTSKSIAGLEQALMELPGQERYVNASFQRDQALLGQERIETQAQSAQVVTASMDGLVASKLIKPGQSVQAGQPLLNLLPKDEMLEAELFVPSRAAGFIDPGDRVLLRYQSFPYQKFGHHTGRVIRISRAALSGDEIAALGGGTTYTEPAYRIAVSLDRQTITAYGKQENLRPGMLIEADVLGDRRRLVEWVFEPLYSLSGKIGGE